MSLARPARPRWGSERPSSYSSHKPAQPTSRGPHTAPASAALVTVGDFHPATLSWLGAVAGNAIVPLGVDRFGQSGDIPDLYRAYGIDTDAILDAAARACLAALPRTARHSG